MRYTLKIHEGNCSTPLVFSIDIEVEDEQKAIEKAESLAKGRFFRLELIII